MPAGFPNLFTVTGPGSPGILSNVVVGIEQHVDWIVNCIESLMQSGGRTIESSPDAERAWAEHAKEVASGGLFHRASSWFFSPPLRGRERVFMPNAGGQADYDRICAEIAADGYRGFEIKR